MKKLFIVLSLVFASTLTASEFSFKPAIRVIKAELYNNITFPSPDQTAQGILLGFEIAACRKLSSNEFIAEINGEEIEVTWVNPVDCFGPTSIQVINLNLNLDNMQSYGPFYIRNPILMDYKAF